LGTRPGSVAGAHADRVEGAPHSKALVADVEVALFEMPQRRVGQVLGMRGQVDLAVSPDDPASASTRIEVL
jgi:hypothetical protein